MRSQGEIRWNPAPIGLALRKPHDQNRRWLVFGHLWRILRRIRTRGHAIHATIDSSKSVCQSGSSVSDRTGDPSGLRSLVSLNKNPQPKRSLQGVDFEWVTVLEVFHLRECAALDREEGPKSLVDPGPLTISKTL